MAKEITYKSQSNEVKLMWAAYKKNKRGRYSKRHKKDPQTPEEKEEAKKAKENKEPHISLQTQVIGCLVKGSGVGSPRGKVLHENYYTYNAWCYLGDSKNREKGRGIYQLKKNGGEARAEYEEYVFYDKDSSHNFNLKFKRSDIDKVDCHSALVKDFELKRQLEKELGESVSAGNASQEKDLRAKLKEVKFSLYVLIQLRLQSRKNGLVGSSLPYDFQAHHIIPMNVFQDHFTEEQRQVLYRSPYNINDGRNMIFLPSRKRYSEVHGIPYHWGNHLKYNNEVETATNDVRQEIDELIGEEKPHKEVEQMAAEKLHEIETELFEHIVDLGPGSRLD